MTRGWGGMAGKERPEERRRRNYEVNMPLGEQAGDFLTRVLENRSEWTERIELKPDGSFVGAGKGNHEMNHIAIAQHEYDMQLDVEGLYQIAKKITVRYPGLAFDFKRDPAGTWVEYTVRMHAA